MEQLNQEQIAQLKMRFPTLENLDPEGTIYRNRFTDEGIEVDGWIGATLDLIFGTERLLHEASLPKEMFNQLVDDFEWAKDFIAEVSPETYMIILD